MTREKTVLYLNSDHDRPPTDLLHRIALTSELTSLTDARAVYDLNPRQRTTLYARYPTSGSQLNKRRSGYTRKKRSSLEMQRLHNLKREERVLSEPVRLPAIGRRAGPAHPSYGIRNVAGSLEATGREAPRSRWRLTHGNTSTYRSTDSVTVHKAVSYDLGERLGDITDLKASVRRQMERYREWHDEQKRRQLQEVRLTTAQGRCWQDDRLLCPGVSKEIVQRRTTRSRCPVHHLAEDKPAGVIKTIVVETHAEDTRYNRDVERVQRFEKKLPQVMGLPPVGSSSIECDDVVRMRQRGDCVKKLPEVAANVDYSATPEEVAVCDGSSDSYLVCDARPESPPAEVPAELRMRVFSAKTWRTWRSVNESYAYKDVSQYIEDNDLMTDEKASRIQDWMASVVDPPPHTDTDTPQAESVDGVEGEEKREAEAEAEEEGEEREVCAL